MRFGAVAPAPRASRVARIRARRAAMLMCAAFTLSSCSRERPPEAAQAVSKAPAPPAAGSASSAPSDTSPIARPAAFAPRPTWFPHAPHLSARIACRTCHGAIPGHATHAGVACQQCHAPPANVSSRAPPKIVCLSCHHGADQKVSCRTCHNPLPAPLTLRRTIQLSVWSQPRTRSLVFPHARHAALACTECHNDRPLLTPTRTCGSCHAQHHRAGADCSTCHAAPPPTAHSLRAHVSCSGGGCHAARLVRSIPRTRAVCLVCHRDRVNHQPGKECASCHRVEFGS